MTSAKFTDLHERISRTKPTAEMAIYCTNAMLNAALRSPLENPAESELWYLPEVLEIIERNPEWVIRVIDRCAYRGGGRKNTFFEVLVRAQ